MPDQVTRGLADGVQYASAICKGSKSSYDVSSNLLSVSWLPAAFLSMAFSPYGFIVLFECFVFLILLCNNPSFDCYIGSIYLIGFKPPPNGQMGI
jgi:hypothetical protein